MVELIIEFFLKKKKKKSSPIGFDYVISLSPSDKTTSVTALVQECPPSRPSRKYLERS